MYYMGLILKLFAQVHHICLGQSFQLSNPYQNVPNNGVSTNNPMSGKLA